MRVFGCLSWFDEDPRWLAASVAGFAKVCDHLIAVDGAYLFYPEGRCSSGGDQAETIQTVAAACGLGCTVHVPATVWTGNEVEKRNTYLQIACTLGTAYEDWVMVLDADEEITAVSPLARADLMQTTLNAATLGFWTTDELRTWFGPTRRVYRLVDGMRYGPSHFTVSGFVGDSRVFLDGRGAEWGEPLEDALDLTAQIRVEHKAHLRPQARAERADEFDRRRVSENLEPWVRPVTA